MMEGNIEDKLETKMEGHERFVTERRDRRCCRLLVFFTLISLCTFLAGIVLMLTADRTSVKTAETNLENIIDMSDYCKPSKEALRIKLQPFLAKCQVLYFKLYPSAELHARRYEAVDGLDTIARKFTPFMPSPEFLKDFADQTSSLKKELKGLKADKRKLKPKESQTLAEIQVFLDQFMAEVYDLDFYGGDWMLGPNIFCMNVICKLDFEVKRFLTHIRLKTKEDINSVINTFHAHKKTFAQYKYNMQLGVTTGMVKSRSSCIAGSDALKQYYSHIINKEDGGAETVIPGDITTSLPSHIKKAWKNEHGETVRKSLKRAWVDGFSSPLLKLIKYIEEIHIQHCPPDDVASGVSSLPLNYVYVNGSADKSRVTTKKLPLTNGTLDGKELYRKLVPRFTTTNITPEEIFAEGERQLKIFYRELITATKAYTKENDEETAVKKMRKVFEGDDQWHGDLTFPANESDQHAYKVCRDDTSAKKYCPMRWKSIQKWGMYMYGVMGMIHPKLNEVFHFTGDYASVPSCPVEVIHHYNPSNGAMYFEKNVGCVKPCQFALPFFLEKYGPKYWEWSVNGHEARPGHHIQYQGMFEVFPYPCSKGLPSFFHDMAYCTSFIEGWALYGENPVLSHDVNLYKDNLLQKIGMLKWQIWRAVRLVVDSGLHYRNKNRTWALQKFRKYTWDETDFGKKEVTRYMSCPGQATAYMIGRLAMLKARRKAERELGNAFKLKDFHYQVLSLGQSPLGYLEEHINRYISCVEDPSQLYCDYMLTPVHGIPKEDNFSSPLPARRHYV